MSRHRAATRPARPRHDAGQGRWEHSRRAGRVGGMGAGRGKSTRQAGWGARGAQSAAGARDLRVTRLVYTPT